MHELLTMIVIEAWPFFLVFVQIIKRKKYKHFPINKILLPYQ